jgi:hypothetical protein
LVFVTPCVQVLEPLSRDPAVDKLFLSAVAMQCVGVAQEAGLVVSPRLTVLVIRAMHDTVGKER